MMQNLKITFIGSGHMAQSIISGLINSHIPATNIWATGTNTDRLTKLATKLGIHTTNNNQDAVKNADIVILAVPPQIVKTIVSEIHPHLRATTPTIISLAAGIKYKQLQNYFTPNTQIVCAMPNTPTAINAGVTALFAPSNNAALTIATQLFQLVGKTVELDNENLFDIVTVLSGCGPAYFYLMMEALQNAATDLGLPEATARTLTVQTAMGAAKMATEHTKPLSQLCDEVAPKGGITEQAIISLKNNKIEKIFADALKAAKNKLSS